MSVTVQFDDFNRTSGAVASPWTVKTGDTWTLTGSQLRVDGTPAPFRRAILQAVDPYSLVTGTTTKSYDVSVDFETPAVYSSTEDAYAGIVFMSAGANAAFSSFEFVWWRDSSGNQRIRWQYRSSAGTLFTLPPVLGYLLTGAQVAAAGSIHTLAVKVSFTVQASNAPITVTGSLDGVQLYGSGIIFPSTLGFSSGNIATTPHYAGLMAQVPGPLGTVGNNHGFPIFSTDPQYPILFDNFRVRDVGALAVQPVIYPAPTLTTAATLTPISVAAEDDSGAETLTLPHHYTYSVQDQFASTDHPYDAGYVASVARSTRRRRTWALHWDAINTTDRATLLTLSAAVNVRKKAFSWTDPETGEVVLVRIVSEVRTSQIGPAVWAASFDVQEIFVGA